MLDDTAPMSLRNCSKTAWLVIPLSSSAGERKAFSRPDYLLSLGSDQGPNTAWISVTIRNASMVHRKCGEGPIDLEIDGGEPDQIAEPLFLPLIFTNTSENMPSCSITYTRCRPRRRAGLTWSGGCHADRRHFRARLRHPAAACSSGKQRTGHSAGRTALGLRQQR